MKNISRRSLFGLTLAATGATFAASAHASGSLRRGSDLDPSDRLPRWYSVNRFLRLSKNQVYDLARAVRLGRSFTIEGYTRSQTADIIQLANRDLAAAHALLSN
ncbi:MAG: hypothetical protein AAF280_12810 [Pseudomonadota bacterium]